MRGQRFTKEEILKILKEVQEGKRVTEICPRYGISEQTFYRWKTKFKETDDEKSARIRMLETENEELKHAITRLNLENESLKERVAEVHPY